MRSVLLDSGPLIALFAVDDRHHRRFDRVLAEMAPAGLRLMTTWPCIVEAAHILKALHRYEMLGWVESGGVLVYPFEPHHLKDMAGWMRRYTARGGREMDLADASIYWLSVETGVTEVMTVDIADFSRYRLPDGRMFTIV